MTEKQDALPRGKASFFWMEQEGYPQEEPRGSLPEPFLPACPRFSGAAFPPVPSALLHPVPSPVRSSLQTRMASSAVFLRKFSESEVRDVLSPAPRTDAPVTCPHFVHSSLSGEIAFFGNGIFRRTDAIPKSTIRKADRISHVGIASGNRYCSVHSPLPVPMTPVSIT